jgi:perosamine synthetase
MIPLSVPYLTGSEKRYLMECLDSGWVSSAGPWVTRFEDQFSSLLGGAHSAAVSSGTAALHLALRTLGIGSESPEGSARDAVLVPSLTFIASINSIRYAGARPIFLDCDSTLNLNLEHLDEFLKSECDRTPDGIVHRSTQLKVKAIMPVHIFGGSCDIEQLLRIASHYDLRVIEDATEAFGSSFASEKPSQGSRPLGTWGDVGCFSFNGNKIITTGGGGMVVSQNADWIRKIKFLSSQAKADELFFVHDEVGYNYRLTSLQAAFGLGQLDGWTQILEKKQKIHSIYRKELAKHSQLELVANHPRVNSNHWMNTVRISKEALEKKGGLAPIIRQLEGLGIQARPIWKANHEQKPYLHEVKYRLERTSTEIARCLSIPSSVEMSSEQQRFVLDALLKTI